MEDEYLLLSGIQHFAFCRRQWALIHIEQQWRENLRTVEGERLHKKAHDGPLFERREDLLIVRALDVSSGELGIVGTCDMVEFQNDEAGIALIGRRGRFRPVPVEYKRGRPKCHNADMLQLCAQAMCLEESLVCEVPKGYLFYGEPRHRTEVIFDSHLRTETRQTTEEMHQLYRRRHTPKVKPGSFCRSCSLVDICLPKLIRAESVEQYILKHIEDDR